MPSNEMIKLTNEEIKWLINRVGSGFFAMKIAAQVYGMTERCSGSFAIDKLGEP
jgi:hypothetical protein